MTSNIQAIQENPFKATLMLGVPIMFILFLNTAYAVADAYWISFLGQSAVIALGYISNISYAYNKIGDGIGRSTSVLIGNSFGAKDYKKANNIAMHGLLINVLISILIPLIALASLKPLFNMMGVGAYSDLILAYLEIPLIFVIIVMMNNFFSSILGSEGDTKRAAYILTLANFANIILNPIFIFDFKMGMFGVGLATTISCFLALLGFLYLYFNRKDTVLRLSLSDFEFDMGICKEIIVISIPIMLDGLVISILGLIINYALLLYAPQGVIFTFVILLRLQTTAFTPIQGLNKGLCITISHLFGAKRYNVLKSTILKIAGLGIVMGIIVSIILCLFIKQIMFHFTGDPMIIKEATNQLLFIIIFLLLHPIIVSATYGFIGIKKSHYSLFFIVLNIMLFIFFTILLVNLCDFGKYTVFVSITLSDITQTILIVFSLNRKLTNFIKMDDAIPS